MNNFDVVMPKGNEEEFIDAAISLGYDEIVFLTEDTNYKKPSHVGIKIKTALLIHNTSQINSARKKFDYIVANAERKFFESKIDYIIGLESGDKDSFHYRSTPLNQVHAELCRKNGISVVFDFGSLFNNIHRALGRMIQNAFLVRKYRLQRDILSIAQRPCEMRSKNIFDALRNFLDL